MVRVEEEGYKGKGFFLIYIYKNQKLNMEKRTKNNNNNSNTLMDSTLGCQIIYLFIYAFSH